MSSKAPAHHVLDVYGAHVWLAWTPKQWRKLMRTFDSLEESDRDSLGSTCVVLDREHPFEPHLVVWIDLESHGGDALSLVRSASHEAAHVASMLLSHLGHKLVAEDEPHAYLVGWATAWIIEQIEWKL